MFLKKIQLYILFIFGYIATDLLIEKKNVHIAMVTDLGKDILQMYSLVQVYVINFT